MKTDKMRLMIGQQIRKRRVEFNLSQENLASKVGIRKATLSEIENGSNCTLNTLLEILKNLDGKVEVTFKQA
jgi:transcriptional regulator with XRE-family HTH domain